MPEALRAVRLGRRLELADQRDLATEGDLDIGPPGELQHGARVDRDLGAVDVAGDARRGDDLGLRRRGGVEQREAVVDAGVDIEDERGAVGHGPMLPGGGSSGRRVGGSASFWRRAHPAGHSSTHSEQRHGEARSGDPFVTVR